MPHSKDTELTEIDVAEERDPETTAVEPTDNKSEPVQHESKSILGRYINPAALVNFGFTLQASWEGSALSFQFSLLNGGPASLVYGSIIAGLGSSAIAISLAEMASMDPVVGAQYRWTAAFATSNPEFWGLLQGWITVFAWIACTAASPAFLANVVIGLLIFNYPDYVPHPWHGTLMMFGFVIIPVLFNLWFRKLLNTLEMAGGICHVLFFIISVITLVVLAKRSTADFVFNNLTDDLSGWTNPAVAFNLGLLTIVFPLTSFDGVLHMSDEVKGPRTRVPRSMIMAVVMNFILQFAFMVVLMFCIGDLDAVASSPTGMPIIEVFYEATKSKHATNFFVVMILMIVVISLFNIFASVSRLTWAFSRDKGLPFHDTFAKVNSTLRIPLNALLLVGVICCLLALINLGSTTAFNALVSIPTITLYISYFIPIFLILLRKVRGMHPQYGPFKLGRWGIPINTFACVYALYILIWTPFPQILPVTAANMNYAGPVVGGVILLALADWVVSGRKRFKVPVAPRHKHDN